MNTKIIVIESGFVYIGNAVPFECHLLGKAIQVQRAQNIERWGTSEGLGQLANVGKQTNTRLRFTGTITVPVSKILHLIDVEIEAAKSFGYEG